MKTRGELHTSYVRAGLKALADLGLALAAPGANCAALSMAYNAGVNARLDTLLAQLKELARLKRLQTKNPDLAAGGSSHCGPTEGAAATLP